jgi:hypothetical protein
MSTTVYICTDAAHFCGGLARGFDPQVKGKRPKVSNQQGCVLASEFSCRECQRLERRRPRLKAIFSGLMKGRIALLWWQLSKDSSPLDCDQL